MVTTGNFISHLSVFIIEMNNSNRSGTEALTSRWIFNKNVDYVTPLLCVVRVLTLFRWRSPSPTTLHLMIRHILLSKIPYLAAVLT